MNSLTEFIIGDVWFCNHYGTTITREFLSWWLEFYGTPNQYVLNKEELHEYYLRCAFAWHGWKASKDHLSSSE